MIVLLNLYIVLSPYRRSVELGYSTFALTEKFTRFVHTGVRQCFALSEGLNY